MARSEARISVDVWDLGTDFVGLSHDAQWAYFFLLSQPDLSHAGVIGLRERRWARVAPDITADDLTRYLKELEFGHKIVVDYEAEELLVRALIRRDKVYRQPNVLRSARDQLVHITSPRIRAALVDELRRIQQLEMPAGSADIVEEMLRELGWPGNEGFGDDDTEPPSNPSGNPSGNSLGDGDPLPKTSRNPSGRSPENGRNHVSAGREGSPKGTGESSAGTPGERGVVTAVSGDSPNPSPHTIPPPAARLLAGEQGALDGMPEPPPPEEPPAKDRAFGIARWWIASRLAKGTPVVPRTKNTDPLHVLRGLIEPFAESGYTDDEIRQALVDLRQSCPTTNTMDRQLAENRTERAQQQGRRNGDLRRAGPSTGANKHHDPVDRRPIITGVIASQAIANGGAS
jgi:hypothetical protein